MAGQRIIVAPLDWGLGHATRCIPVIRELLNFNHRVFIAADGNTELILREEFPDLQFIFLKGYHIRYSTWLPTWLMVLFQFPKIIWRALIEHQQLKKLIDTHKFDIVISDNRFGLWNKKIKSIYITHQLRIKFPSAFKIFEPLLSILHRSIINHYTFCWIPDVNGKINLSGDLTRNASKGFNSMFIGPLSRFKNDHEPQSEINATRLSISHDLCVIISGPESSRSDFEKKILDILKGFQGRAAVVCGDPNGKNKFSVNRIDVFAYLGSTRLKELILKSKLIICRAGYSSIMDLVTLKKEAVLIPTQGQTEQEYLAEYLDQQKIFKTIQQSKLRLSEFNYNADYSVSNLILPQSNLLREAIATL